MSEERLLFDGIFSESQLVQDEAHRGVVRNVLLCGNRSLNNYDIPASAFGAESRVRELYNNACVYLDHDETRGPNRSVRELAGVIANPRLFDGKPRGDIILNENASGQEVRAIVKLAEKAKGMGAALKNVGLSHVASYRFSPDRKRVESVLSVYSVDVVCRPATTNSLYESTGPKPFNVSESLERLLADTDAALFEKYLGKATQRHSVPDFDPLEAIDRLLNSPSGKFNPAVAVERLLQAGSI